MRTANFAILLVPATLAAEHDRYAPLRLCNRAWKVTRAGAACQQEVNGKTGALVGFIPRPAPGNHWTAATGDEA